MLERFAGVPLLRAFEAANLRLGHALDGAPTTPRVRAICVGAAGVTFHLAGPSGTPPAEFTDVGGHDDNVWHVGHDVLDSPVGSFPFVPIVFPVGDDGDGTWLVPLGPGDVLPVLGAGAPGFWRAARGAACSWAWSEAVLVTEDPHDPALRAEADADPALGRHILFCGDHAALPPAVAPRCAVVTMDPLAASDLTVLVDTQGATLHPMGRVLRPHLQSAATAAQIDELMTAAPAHVTAQPAAAAAATATPAAPQTRPGRGRLGAVPTETGPGTVDVRLLTMTPRLDGLREDLPPNRARRAIELIAYLALHRDDLVTSDRLRTRVLGSADTDAASKTLFNTAYAARRAMGVDEEGAPLFPTGTRHGLYALSPHVTVDVERAIALTQEGAAQADPDASIAFYRAALELVEGEPLANVLSGYAWWEAEGHGGRVAAALVDAACAMAALTAASAHYELGRWGLDQARIVEPYSEALSRAAMQLAAAEGDADRLRLEWRECQRRVDALDPGGSPSARTESLYGELARKVLVGAGPRSAAGPGGGNAGGAAYEEPDSP